MGYTNLFDNLMQKLARETERSENNRVLLPTIDQETIHVNYSSMSLEHELAQEETQEETQEEANNEESEREEESYYEEDSDNGGSGEIMGIESSYDSDFRNRWLRRNSI